MGLVIRGGYVPLFWTVNTEFADKKTRNFAFYTNFTFANKQIR